MLKLPTPIASNEMSSTLQDVGSLINRHSLLGSIEKSIFTLMPFPTLKLV